MILDLAMPVMDGLEALPEIRVRSPESKIVVLSGFNASQMSAEALSLGASSYLEKGGIVDRLVPQNRRLEVKEDAVFGPGIDAAISNRPNGPPQRVRSGVRSRRRGRSVAPGLTVLVSEDLEVRDRPVPDHHTPDYLVRPSEAPGA